MWDEPTNRWWPTRALTLETNESKKKIPYPRFFAVVVFFCWCLRLEQQLGQTADSGQERHAAAPPLRAPRDVRSIRTVSCFLRGGESPPAPSARSRLRARGTARPDRLAEGLAPASEYLFHFFEEVTQSDMLQVCFFCDPSWMFQPVKNVSQHLNAQMFNFEE